MFIKLNSISMCISSELFNCKYIFNVHEHLMFISTIAIFECLSVGQKTHTKNTRKSFK